MTDYRATGFSNAAYHAYDAVWTLAFGIDRYRDIPCKYYHACTASNSGVSRSLFNWVQAIKGGFTGGCIKLMEVCISDCR